MSKAKSLKLPSTPKHAEPFTVSIVSLESYNEMTQQEPYIFLQRSLPQYVFALMLQKLHSEGKRYVRIIVPLDVFNASYRHNPAMFAAIVRRQRNCPFQYVTMRLMRQENAMKITASETAPQKAGSYLGACTAAMLGEKERVESTQGPGAGFKMMFPYADMPRAYQNDSYVFRYRVQEALRRHTEDNITLTLRPHVNGHILVRTPTTA